MCELGEKKDCAFVLCMDSNLSTCLQHTSHHTPTTTGGHPPLAPRLPHRRRPPRVAHRLWREHRCAVLLLLLLLLLLLFGCLCRPASALYIYSLFIFINIYIYTNIHAKRQRHGRPLGAQSGGGALAADPAQPTAPPSSSSSLLLSWAPRRCVRVFVLRGCVCIYPQK